MLTEREPFTLGSDARLERGEGHAQRPRLEGITLGGGASGREGFDRAVPFDAGLIPGNDREPLGEADVGADHERLLRPVGAQGQEHLGQQIARTKRIRGRAGAGSSSLKARVAPPPLPQFTLMSVRCQPDEPSGATGARSSIWTKPFLSTARTAT